MTLCTVKDESEFRNELGAAGVKLVVVDFYATWCGPCQRIAPFIESLPTKYPQAVFLKVDVDKMPEVAASEGVSAMPTFIMYRNRAKIDRFQGSDILGLETKIQKNIGTSAEDSDDYGTGLMDLNGFIQRNQCECLNECDEHPMVHCLKSSDGYLKSDVDEQLILSITFNQAVKIHSLKINAPCQVGPKAIKIFINQPRTIDFDMAETYNSVQDLCLGPKDLDGEPVKLKYVKFQNVSNIQIYVKTNQNGGEITQIDYLGFIGTPLATTKMEDFKRVAGKKGESH